MEFCTQVLMTFFVCTCFWVFSMCFNVISVDYPPLFVKNLHIFAALCSFLMNISNWYDLIAMKVSYSACQMWCYEMMHQSAVYVLGGKRKHWPCWVTAILQTVCVDVFQEHGVKDDELQSILNYLLTMHEVSMQTQTPWPLRVLMATRWRHNTNVPSHSLL